MKIILQILTILLLLNPQTVYADNTSNAQSAFEKADAFANQGNYAQALKYYKISYDFEPADGAAFDIGYSYEELKDYDNAIKWYKKSFKMGYPDGAFTLGLLYATVLKDYSNAIKWYKKAINQGDIHARKNLGLLYHEQKDDLNSAVYMMGMIGHPYTKERVLGLLRNDWKIDEMTLKKAYKLQKKLIPDPYYDSEFEDAPAHKRERRRR